MTGLLIVLGVIAVSVVVASHLLPPRAARRQRAKAAKMAEVILQERQVAVADHESVLDLDPDDRALIELSSGVEVPDGAVVALASGRVVSGSQLRAMRRALTGRSFLVATPAAPGAGLMDVAAAVDVDPTPTYREELIAIPAAPAPTPAEREAYRLARANEWFGTLAGLALRYGVACSTCGEPMEFGVAHYCTTNPHTTREDYTA